MDRSVRTTSETSGQDNPGRPTSRRVEQRFDLQAQGIGFRWVTLVLTSMFASLPASAQDYDYSSSPAPILWTSFAIIIIGILVYFIPSMVAFWRRHPNRWPILGINILFGGTGLGWIGALIWALHAAHLSETGSDGGESGLNLFVNDVKTIRMEPERPGSGSTANEPLGDLHSRAGGLHHPNAGPSSSPGPIEPTDTAGQALAPAPAP